VRMGRDEFKTLQDLLSTAYTTADELEGLIARTGRNLQHFVALTTLPTMIGRVMVAANNEGWWPELVQALKADRPDRADIQAFAIRFPTAPAPAPASGPGSDPYDDHVVRSLRVLVNRRKLRSIVRELEERTAHRLLVVTGGRKMGKTYSRHFITHIHDRRQTFQLGWINLVDLHSPSEGPLTPQPVVERVFAHLGLDPDLVPQPEDERYDRWSQRVCNLLIRKLPKPQAGVDPVPTWLVMDGFNAVPVHEGTIAFVQELARQVEGALSVIRLILLDWTRELPEDAEVIALRETVTPFSDDDLKDFFERVHRARAANAPQGEPGEEELARRVAQSVANIKQAVPSGDAAINELLGSAVAREWERLLQA
jgi:hypothetical protein